MHHVRCDAESRILSYSTWLPFVRLGDIISPKTFPAALRRERRDVPQLSRVPPAINSRISWPYAMVPQSFSYSVTPSTNSWKSSQPCEDESARVALCAAGFLWRNKIMLARTQIREVEWIDGALFFCTERIGFSSCLTDTRQNFYGPRLASRGNRGRDFKSIIRRVHNILSVCFTCGNTALKERKDHS